MHGPKNETNTVFRKMLVISWLFKDLLASQK